MKHGLLLSIFCLACCLTAASQKNIVEELQRQKDGEGSVTVTCAPEITALIGTPAPQVSATAGQQAKVEGYRIVVYMGNNATKSRNEATSRQALIRDRFPEMNTYVRYEAPNWKVFAGDFLSQEAATATKRELQKAFPEFGKEMFVVTDKVLISQIN
jgi:hypothetical protein